MAANQPTNIYVNSLDSESLGGASFVTNLPGGVLNLVGLDLTEFLTYNLLKTFPVNDAGVSVINVRIFDATAPTVPLATNTSQTILNGFFASPSEVAATLEIALRAWGSTLAISGDPAIQAAGAWLLTTNCLALPWGQIAIGNASGGYLLEFLSCNQLTTDNCNAWLGVEYTSPSVPNTYKVLSSSPLAPLPGPLPSPDFDNVGYLPNPARIIRTSCFYVRCSLNSADSIAVRPNSLADRTILAKIPIDTSLLGDTIYYQPTIPDPVSKNAIGSTVYDVYFQILDDRFVLIREFPGNVPIHLSFRCMYESGK